jgi:hypothetical protein
MHHLGGYSWYASHRKELEDLHEELVKLNPGNEKFIGMQKKFLKEKKDQEEITNSKIESAKKQQEERIASFGEPPDPSRWGLHGYEGPVMEYLKQRAHNPPSVSIIGCSKPGYTSDGWILFCEYRGQNAFGAMIHTTKAFTIVNGKVTKMEDPIVYGQ